ncbi:uncharacterized protein [Arachis hypogaea]|uniref:uncharacterized protein n=1 Tax=Arachis hypogaea TaxID=3818 RepID=UPI003B220754
MSRNGGGFNQDPSNHFFLHPSENPSLAITNVIFNGKNYGDWSRSMVRALKSKNKIKFIDGSLPRPEIHDPTYEAWERCNTYAVLSGDKFRVAELQEELYALKQGDMNVTAYFTELKKMWEELDSFRTISSCSYGRDCSCGLGVVRNFRTEDQVTRFLRGLNEQYAGVRSQVMLMDPLPSLNTVFSLLTQQERQFQSFDFTSDNKLIAAARSATLLNTAEDSHSRGRGRGRGGRNQGFGRGQGG